MVTTEITESLLSKEAAALYLGVSLSTIDKFCRDKKLNALKIGKGVRFEVSNLEALKNRSRRF